VPVSFIKLPLITPFSPQSHLDKNRFASLQRTSTTKLILPFFYRHTGITLSSRCRLLPESTDARRGVVAFIGPVPEIPGAGGPWIGIALDEPTGKNDGSVQGVKYFDAGGKNRGVFVRPERVEVGDFPVLDELGEEMEEM
jgi:adenylate cyclase associated (CAP) protein